MLKKTNIWTCSLLFFLCLSFPAYAKAVKLGRIAEENIGLNTTKIPTRKTDQTPQKILCATDKDCKKGYRCNDFGVCEDKCLTMTISNAQICDKGQLFDCARGSQCNCPTPQVANGMGVCIEPCTPNPCSGTTPVCVQSGVDYTCQCSSTSCQSASKCSIGTCVSCYAGEKCGCAGVSNGTGSCVVCTTDSHCSSSLKCLNTVCVTKCTGVTCSNGQTCNSSTGTCQTCCTAPANGYCSGCNRVCNSGYLLSGSLCVRDTCVAPQNGRCSGGVVSCNTGYTQYSGRCIQTCNQAAEADGFKVVQSSADLDSALSNFSKIAVFSDIVRTNAPIVIAYGRTVVGPRYFKDFPACKSASTYTLNVTGNNHAVELGGALHNTNVTFNRTGTVYTTVMKVTSGNAKLSESIIRANPAHYGIYIPLGTNLEITGNVTVEPTTSLNWEGHTMHMGISFGFFGRDHGRGGSLKINNGKLTITSSPSLANGGSIRFPVFMDKATLTLDNNSLLSITVQSAYADIATDPATGSTSYITLRNNSHLFLNSSLVYRGAIQIRDPVILDLCSNCSYYSASSWNAEGTITVVSATGSKICVRPRNVDSSGAGYLRGKQCSVCTGLPCYEKAGGSASASLANGLIVNPMYYSGPCGTYTWKNTGTSTNATGTWRCISEFNPSR